jgi:hypothetical protein
LDYFVLVLLVYLKTKGDKMTEQHWFQDFVDSLGDDCFYDPQISYEYSDIGTGMPDMSDYTGGDDGGSATSGQN